MSLSSLTIPSTFCSKLGNQSVGGYLITESEETIIFTNISIQYSKQKCVK